MQKDPAKDIRAILKLQFDMAWQLFEYHINGLTEEECLWRPSEKGLHVHLENGNWRADWPDTEAYSIGPASIAWLTWHIIFWWSMTIDFTFGSGRLAREDVCWPGSIAAVKEKIETLRREWLTAIDSMPDEELHATGRTNWPFADKPFYELPAWLNMELMKNVAEIGCGRFLYASRT